VSQRGETAVVCGASMAGLLAARVLSDFYGTVTLVERDVLPEQAIQRRGVSQGHHLHALMSRGSRALGQLFPGLSDELEAAGAGYLDGSDPSVAYMRVAGHVLAPSGEYTDPKAIATNLASRPLLEAHVRRRVRAIENVRVLDGHEVIEPTMDHPDRVAGVRVASRDTGAERRLDADLVVAATGRSARTPAFLEARGYGRPVEQRYTVNLNYSSQFFRVPEGLLTEKTALVAPTLERLTGAGLLAYENGIVVLTLIGNAGEKLPTDPAGVMATAAELMPPHITTALRAAEPLGPVSAQNYPASVWRRYDKMRRFPKGFLVIGDALCSFNPVYGQGMTSAALQAIALRDCLASGTADDVRRRYFRKTTKKLRPIWQGNRINDFVFYPAQDWRAVPKRLLNWYMDKLMAAAANDIVLTEMFVRTLHLLDPPSRLMHPDMLMRIINGQRRRAGAAIGTGVTS
jgi:2-polyprenyl-6-methoxyphenol hydroxylase-like FAD-dependent oxidoreductase